MSRIVALFSKGTAAPKAAEMGVILLRHRPSTFHPQPPFQISFSSWRTIWVMGIWAAMGRNISRRANIDALAELGMRFTQAYAGGPVYLIAKRIDDRASWRSYTSSR